MKKRYEQKHNILLVNITRLGDMLQATPTIAGMKQENPGAKVTVVVEKQFSEVCHFIPNIDEVVSLDLGFTVRALAREQDGIVDAFEYLSSVVDDLRQRNFDYCLNMSSSAYTALLISLIGIKRNGGWTADDEGYRRIESEWAKLFATSVFHQNRQLNSLNLVDVFRCSADVEQHPRKLLISISKEAKDYAHTFVTNAGFTNKGPLIAIQAGASQDKRQWHPRHFIRLISWLIDKLDARVVLTGAKKELEIIEPIQQGVNSPNVVVAAGKTSIPQLAALLEVSDILVTGDTGPMHVSVAVGTPVVAMFLASAFGFETGPYSEGNLVLQPVIGCGPCNPNKPCARPDCHDTIEPEVLAELVAMRLKEDFTSLPPGLVDPRKVILYRSYFDEYGYCDLKPLNLPVHDHFEPYRRTYRKLWLDELGNYPVPKGSALKVIPGAVEGLEDVAHAAQRGIALIGELVRLIKDTRAPANALSSVSTDLTELDRRIEQLGFHHNVLGPLTRMFIFAKENLEGTEPLELASQMETVYRDLARRSEKFSTYYTQG